MIHLLENVSQKWRVDHNFDSTNRHKWLLEDDHHQLQFGHNRDVQGGGAEMKLSGARAEFRRALRDFRPSRIKVGGGGAGPDRPALVT